jgi:hypothetical protein
MNAPETIILEDPKVRISNTKVKFGVNTFYINNMSSVSIFEKKPPRIPYGVLSVAGLIAGVWVFSKYGYTNFTVYLCLLVFLIGAAMAIFPKKKFIVRVVSSGIASDGLETTDRKYAQQVVDAINQALETKA